MALSRAGRTVYRSLLRWCRSDLARRVPFTLPVLAPELERLWPAQPVLNAEGTERLIRELFRAGGADLDLGLVALRELDKFGPLLERCEESRAEHSSREGVRFGVGQVVRDSRSGCRGVVYGWDRTYQWPSPPAHEPARGGATHELKGKGPFYHILPDHADCMAFIRQPKEFLYASEAQLEPVEPVAECRIDHPLIQNAFDRFDSASARFVPNEMLRYQYPGDVLGAAGGNRLPAPELDLINGTLDAAWQRLEPMVEAAGELWPELVGAELGLAFKRWDQPGPSELHKLHNLRTLYLVAHHLLSRRRLSERQKANPRFQVGQVVEHKKYSFRGVVYGYDSRPMVDVSRWDGVQQLPSGSEQPFYYILPDQPDCLAQFGGPRQSKYVAEENLELLPEGPRQLVQLSEPDHPMFPRGWDPAQQLFLPSLQLRIGYPLEGLGCPEEATGLELLEATTQVVNELAAPRAVLEALLGLLERADHKQQAMLLEDAVWMCWGAQQDPALRNSFVDAVGMLEQGSHDGATEVFNELIEKQPEWAEPWNKRAMARYERGEYAACLSDINQVLRLEPRHFGALCGKARVSEKLKDFGGVIENYSAALALHPWLPMVGAAIQSARQEQGKEGASKVRVVQAIEDITSTK